MTIKVNTIITRPSIDIPFQSRRTSEEIYAYASNAYAGKRLSHFEYLTLNKLTKIITEIWIDIVAYEECKADPILIQAVNERQLLGKGIISTIEITEMPTVEYLT